MKRYVDVPVPKKNLATYKKMPFDMKRMAYGGFASIVNYGG